MRCHHATHSRDDRRFGGVRTPATSCRALSVPTYGYADQAMKWATLATEAPLTG
ncbi:MAG TPA: hypothetical protein VN816_09545 [Acidimicrobiales bacterium]|nr:hypothetical protein [Acidimicrobiales bacterium]